MSDARRTGFASGGYVPRAMADHGAAGAATVGVPAAAAPGMRVKYMSLGSGIYDATVLAVRPDGRIDIETDLHVFLTRIVVAKGVASVEPGQAFIP